MSSRCFRFFVKKKLSKKSGDLGSGESSGLVVRGGIVLREAKGRCGYPRVKKIQIEGMNVQGRLLEVRLLEVEVVAIKYRSSKSGIYWASRVDGLWTAREVMALKSGFAPLLVISHISFLISHSLNDLLFTNCHVKLLIMTPLLLLFKGHPSSLAAR